MKQTAVEWLIEIYLTTGIDRNVHFHQAKEMEKQQIEDAYRFGLSDEYVIGSQHYYNETFKSE
jgi:hypothetical protein